MCKQYVKEKVWQATEMKNRLYEIEFELCKKFNARILTDKFIQKKGFLKSQNGVHSDKITLNCDFTDNLVT